MLSLVHGIYEAIHARSHRKSHQVTIGEGAMFPFCGRCKGEVRFEFLRPAAKDRFGGVSFGLLLSHKAPTNQLAPFKPTLILPKCRGIHIPPFSLRNPLSEEELSHRKPGRQENNLVNSDQYYQPCHGLMIMGREYLFTVAMFSIRRDALAC
jgi:hypothetical protein